MNANKEDKSFLYPIRVVSRRTGIKADRIRAWERRYNAVVPSRSETGRRLYSEQDIERLMLLERLVAGGWHISDIAGESLAALKQMLESEYRGQTEEGLERPDSGGDQGRELLVQSLQAIRALDRDKFEHVLGKAARSLSPVDLRNRLLVPLLEAIGREWRSGTLRIVHEHFASGLIRRFLVLSRRVKTGNRRQGIAIATPVGQLHEFGALMAMAAVEEVGWNAVYLGRDLPAEEIAAAVAELDLHAVALSAIFNTGDDALINEFARIRRMVDPEVVLFIGGRALTGRSSQLADIGWVWLRDFKELKEHLDRLSSRSTHRT